MHRMRRVDGARVTAVLAALIAVLAMHGVVNPHQVSTSVAVVHPAETASHLLGHDAVAPLLPAPDMSAAGVAQAPLCDDCPSHVHAALLLCIVALIAAGAVLLLALTARIRETRSDRGPPLVRRRPEALLRDRGPDLLTQLCISRT